MLPHTRGAPECARVTTVLTNQESFSTVLHSFRDEQRTDNAPVPRIPCIGWGLHQLPHQTLQDWFAQWYHHKYVQDWNWRRHDRLFASLWRDRQLRALLLPYLRQVRLHLFADQDIFPRLPLNLGTAQLRLILAARVNWNWPTFKETAWILTRTSLEFGGLTGDSLKARLSIAPTYVYSPTDLMVIEWKFLHTFVK